MSDETDIVEQVDSSQVEQLTLNHLSNIILDLIDDGEFLTAEDVRVLTFEKNLKQILSVSGLVVESVLEQYDESDTSYKELLSVVYSEGVASVLRPKGSQNHGLLNALALSLALTIMEISENVADVMQIDQSDVSDFVRGAGLHLFNVLGETATPWVSEVFPPSSLGAIDVSMFLDSALLLYARLLDGDFSYDESAVNSEEANTDTEETEEEDLQEEDPEEDLLDSFDDVDLVSTAQVIMRIYGGLFEAGYDLDKPVGILTKQGVVYLNGGTVKLKSDIVSLITLYDLIVTSAKADINSNPVEVGQSIEDSSVVTLGNRANYFPTYHFRALFGIFPSIDVRKATWASVSRMVERNLMVVLRDLKSKGVSLEELRSYLTNCIILAKFSVKESLRIRFYLGHGTSASEFKRIYSQNKASLFSGALTLFNVSENEGVVDALLVFDHKVFLNRPLFAYEAVKALQARGRTPDIDNVILGQTVDGKILTQSMNKQDTSIIAIGAGPRSGKGVLTLNILGAILASGSPLIYLDGKPDMGKAIYEIGMKNGIDPAVWDNSVNFRHDRYNYFGMPDKVNEIFPKIYGNLLYLKVLQIMVIAANLEADSTNDFSLSSKGRPFFIFDEVLNVQTVLSSFWGELVEIGKAKKGSDYDEETIQWCKKIAVWGEALNRDFNGAIVSQLPMSGISSIWLFQTFQKDTWSKYQTPSITQGKYMTFFSVVNARTVLKIMGKGTADSSFSLSEVKDKSPINSLVLGDGRHFALTTTQKVTDVSQLTVFKPYLVLNEAGMDTSYVQQLRKNINDESVWQSLLNEDGVLDQGVGFEGFANLIGADAVQNLGKGREYLKQVLSYIGINVNAVEDYLFDMSIDSFNSLGVMLKSAEVEPDLTGQGGLSFGSDSDYEDTSRVDSRQSFNDQSFGEHDDEEGVNTDFDSPNNNNLADASQDSHPLVNDEPVISGGTRRPSRVTPTTPPLPKPTRQDSLEFSEPPSVQSVTGYARVYNEIMPVPTNPFQTFGTRGVSSSLNAMRMMSGYLIREIKRIFGDLSLVEEVAFTSDGIVINNISIKPILADDIIESMPYALQEPVKRGNYVDLFSFTDLKKFRNMSVLRLDNIRLAEGRFRRELGISPKKDWSFVLSKFRNLRSLYIAGVEITDEASAQSYESRSGVGARIQEKLSDTFNTPFTNIENSLMGKLWKTRPVKITTSALGWTVGVKAVTVAATVFGGWGLLFGAFAGYKAYNTVRKKRNGE